MSPPQISVDVALTLLRNSDTDFLIGYENSVPDPRSLTIEQRKDITAAVLGNPEPHKFIHFHFWGVDDEVRSKQIIMHRYSHARHHDWYNHDDINKLNVFRLAAVTFGLTGIDISVGERCWSVVPKSLKRAWFPNLVQCVDERRAEFARYLANAMLNEYMIDGEADGGDGIYSRYSEEFEIVTDIFEAQNNSIDLVQSASQTALASSSDISVGSLILNPELVSASTNSGSPIAGPQSSSLPAEIESLDLNDDPDAMDLELEHSVNNEDHGEIILL
ncbi:uncharacterized protein EAF01_008597 [Botrytis porri]|uniref:Uncharacterized protein n=1 Tax=Botrytis porri TaxID=87229 RepID=A0A4Z1L0U3_9HELO|nr:uncharacterized protein EAF01_008597 [Botrytis porri]KAF7899384.1 hypothetical protein EAF01_008597 [Botrytis porri]TGO90414.1 hypothetical protein BPOR_0065g00020 [Botrytis porri]